MRYAFVAALALAGAPGVFAQHGHAGMRSAGPSPRGNFRAEGRLYGRGVPLIPQGAFFDPFYSGYTGLGYGEPESTPPPPSPMVIYNPNYQPETAHPQIRDYSNVKLPPAAAPDSTQPDAFLIALKDHSVLMASAYWVQDDTLSYITPEGDHKHVGVPAVDRDLSVRLNAERNLRFQLSGPR